jgi:hypothetical protein
MVKKFERVLSSRASYKKQKEYTFTEKDNEFTEKEFEELIVKARHYTFKQPLMVNKDNGVFVFYKDEFGINIIHYHSFEKFREIK